MKAPYCQGLPHPLMKELPFGEAREGGHGWPDLELLIDASL